MRHGDISNSQTLVIGVRCENCLVRFKESSIIDKAFNLIRGRAHNAEIDEDVLSVMRFIYYRTDYSLSLIVHEDAYTEELHSFLEEQEVPYTEITKVIRSDNEITMKLHTGYLSYYIDSDYNRLRAINSPWAMTVERFNTELRRNVRGIAR